jgi:5-methylcytosine-specific restriction endonuclease McrA
MTLPSTGEGLRLGRPHPQRKDVDVKTAKFNRQGKRVPLHPIVRQSLLEPLQKLYGRVCWYCGVCLKQNQIHLDHITPLSKGGEDTIYNIAISCVSCNRAKWDLTLEQFFAWVKRIRWLENFPAKPAFKAMAQFHDKGDEPEESEISENKTMRDEEISAPIIPEGYSMQKHVAILSAKEFEPVN